MSTKKIGVLLEFNYEDMELWYPLYRLREEGHETFTIGPEKGKMYNSKHGLPCKADFGFDDVKHEDLDALIIPGGFSPDYLRRDKRVLEMVKGVTEAGTTVLENWLPAETVRQEAESRGLSLQEAIYHVQKSRLEARVRGQSWRKPNIMYSLCRRRKLA